MINIYTVQNEAEQAGWQLKSTSYKNLKTNLSYICPIGHEVEISYDEWRKHQQCPICTKLEANKVARNSIIGKSNKNDYRVLALDAATGTTGWAIFDNKKLTAYGTYSTNPTLNTEQRINQVKHWLIENLKIWKPDAIGIEDIQLQKNVKIFQTLANLQGVLIDTLYELNYNYKLALSSSWRAYCGLNHGDERSEAKRKAQAWVHMMYNISPTQDEADAICIGKYFSNEFNKKTTTWGEEI